MTKRKRNNNKTKAEITNGRYSYVESNTKISDAKRRAFDRLNSFDDNAVTQAHFGLEMF